MSESANLTASKFVHLHLHTQYSILDGAANVNVLLDLAKSYNMEAVAITDHGNMFGAMEFYLAAKKRGIKPIIGCEVYVARNTRHEKKTQKDRSGHHLILLAQNKTGYHNLVKLVSSGYIDGFYYTPRIDKELLRKYSEGIIASSACLGGEIPGAILAGDMNKADQALQEYLDIFGDRFYLEVMDHGMDDQKIANEGVLELAAMNNVKVIATNDVHFVKKDDFRAHEILICLSTKRELDDEDGLHYTGHEYLKSEEEMQQIFSENPEVISNTYELAERIEEFGLEKDIILPVFPLPEQFKSEIDYLRHLSFEGAEKRYGEITDEVKQRLDYELEVIGNMGFPGYFLIVQDLIAEARNMGVLVGPGRGSAAGSAVAYCIGITNVDPISYTLLFERFLNPERVSMPDIDIDFDDYGRDSVIQYCIDKYGREKVAQIVTYGTMAAKSSIRDVGRVLKLPLPDTDKLAKLVPDKPGSKLYKAVKEVPELKEQLKSGPELVKQTLTFAQTLEGSVRQTGTHACGIIIGPEDLTNHIPLSTSKDSLGDNDEPMPVTQYEGKLVELAGMLKMDFLGLKTLSIIKDTLEMVHFKHGTEIDLDAIDLLDSKTLDLYQRGDTIGTFQFESDGMREYLKKLKPTNIEDLIAMNALYRPGPMQFIDLYIDRKYGREEIIYPHESLEEILKPTFGIMVYQEQIMQTAQIIGGFTLGKADLLRRAMGKKKMDVMESMKGEFIEGAKEKKVDEKKASEIFSVMQRFAEYGFNRSHSAAYSILAFQTAYCKAHYPAEYMAAVLTHNINDIKKITFFIDECQRMGINVLGPDVNESSLNFTVNDKGEIRFGLVAIKGVGENAAQEIVDERAKSGTYASIFDLAKRVNTRTVNRKNFENLAKAGAFDVFGVHRAAYFGQQNEDGVTFIEKVIKHANDVNLREQAAQASLFGGTKEMEIADPEIPECQAWTELEQLRIEKEIIGFYLSGHPLDGFKREISHFCNTDLSQLKNNLDDFIGKEVNIAGMVIEGKERVGKTGKPFGLLVIEDYEDTKQFFLFGETYLKFKHFLVEGRFLFLKAKVKRREFNNNVRTEIDILDIKLLSELLDNSVQILTLNIPVDGINPSFIDKVQKMIKKHPGKCSLKFRLSGFDGERKSVIHMKNKTTLIQIDCKSFLAEMEKGNNIVKYKFN